MFRFDCLEVFNCEFGQFVRPFKPIKLFFPDLDQKIFPVVYDVAGQVVIAGCALFVAVQGFKSKLRMRSNAPVVSCVPLSLMILPATYARFRVIPETDPLVKFNLGLFSIFTGRLQGLLEVESYLPVSLGLFFFPFGGGFFSCRGDYRQGAIMAAPVLERPMIGENVKFYLAVLAGFLLELLHHISIKERMRWLWASILVSPEPMIPGNSAASAVHDDP